MRDRLDEFACIQKIHHRHHGCHDPATFVEVLLQNTSLVQGDVLARQEVRTGAHPATSAPCEKFKSLIVPTARQFDMWEPAGQEMYTAHVAGTFLDCHEVPGLSDPGQGVLSLGHPPQRRVNGSSSMV